MMLSEHKSRSIPLAAEWIKHLNGYLKAKPVLDRVIFFS